MDESTADNQIRLALAADDPGAVERIWDRYARDLLAYLQAVLCSRVDAEETLQEVFVRLVRSRGHLAQARCLRAYLFQIARHEAATFAKRRRSYPVQPGPWLVAGDAGGQEQGLAEDPSQGIGRPTPGATGGDRPEGVSGSDVPADI